MPRIELKSHTSPSNSSTSLNTPWAAGCWGPKLIVILVTIFSWMGSENTTQSETLTYPMHFYTGPGKLSSLVPGYTGDITGMRALNSVSYNAH